jgi:hypothetical protein
MNLLTEVAIRASQLMLARGKALAGGAFNGW